MTATRDIRRQQEGVLSAGRAAAWPAMLLAAALFATVPTNAAPASGVEAQVRAIRAEYARANALKLKKVSFWMDVTDPKAHWVKGPPGSEGPRLEASLYLDAKGALRRLVIEGGSDDSALRTEEYYGPDGERFFVYIQQGGVGRGSRETRIYYAKGKEIHRLVKGSVAMPPEVKLHQDATAALREFGLSVPARAGTGR